MQSTPYLPHCPLLTFVALQEMIAMLSLSCALMSLLPHIAFFPDSPGLTSVAEREREGIAGHLTDVCHKSLRLTSLALIRSHSCREPHRLSARPRCFFSGVGLLIDVLAKPGHLFGLLDCCSCAEMWASETRPPTYRMPKSAIASGTMLEAPCSWTFALYLLRRCF